MIEKVATGTLISVLLVSVCLRRSVSDSLRLEIAEGLVTKESPPSQRRQDEPENGGFGWAQDVAVVLLQASDCKPSQ